MRKESKISKEENYMDRLSKFDLNAVIDGRNFFVLKSYDSNFYGFNFVENPIPGRMYLQIYLRSKACKPLLEKLTRNGYRANQEINATINSADMKCVCVEGFEHVKAFIKSALHNQSNPELRIWLYELYVRYFKSRTAISHQSSVSSNRNSLVNNYRRFANPQISLLDDTYAPK